MSNNNYFHYTDEHKGFLFYLLSFAMEQYKDEDPLLSECAKELIRYILEMDETEEVVVNELDKYTFMVNYDKYIRICRHAYVDAKKESKNYYYVCYAPSAIFSVNYHEGPYVKYLPMKSLKKICGKYQSKNQIFLQYIQYLDDQEHLLRATLQTPIDQWKKDNYRRFILYLVEDSIVDTTREVFGMESFRGASLNNPLSLCWRYMLSDERGNRGVWNYIREIYLEMSFNTISICFNPSNSNAYKYIKKMENFVNDICPMPITFDTSDYKEKIQYAQSIMDRLVEEFRL